MRTNDPETGVLVVPDPRPRNQLSLGFEPESLPPAAEQSLGRKFDFQSYPDCPHPGRHPIQALCWLVQLLFGLLSLFLMLAWLAAIPLVNFLALGYLLEAEGRVARTGRLRDGLPLLPLAPKLGSMALGVWLWLWPVRWITAAAADAQLIAPDSNVAANWRLAKAIVTTGIAMHLIFALARGGGFWTFFRPIKNVRWLIEEFRAGTYLAAASTAIQEFWSALRIPHHFSLGCRGFLGAFAWLVLPTALFAAMQSTQKPGQVLITLLGGVLLSIVLVWLPFLQARFAAENRLSAFRDVGAVREMFRRAPLASFFALTFLYAVSLPLSLTKIAVPPRDALWMITPIFIATIYPSRLFVGWTYARAQHKERRSWRSLHWTLRGALVPVLAIYLFLLFFTPAIDAYGRRVLFEYPALLIPAPF